MIRLFIGIDFPVLIKQEQATMGTGFSHGKPIAQDLIHLTLRFMGEVNSQDFEDIKEVLESVRLESFDLFLEGVGTFPPSREPKTLWAGIRECPELLQLRQKIEKTLQKAGFQPEGRKYHPHITLCRLKKTQTQRVMDWVVFHGDYSRGPFHIDKFHLYSSQLTPKGPIYKIEKTFFLG